MEDKYEEDDSSQINFLIIEYIKKLLSHDRTNLPIEWMNDSPKWTKLIVNILNAHDLCRIVYQLCSVSLN